MNADEHTALLTFGLRMHAKLNGNMHKGGRLNWLDTRPQVLLQRLRDEVVELAIELEVAEHADDKVRAEAIANECADVANFAMMISDWYLERAKVL